MIIHDRQNIGCDGDVDLQLQRMVDAFLYKPFTPGLELQLLLHMQPIQIDCNYCRPDTRVVLRIVANKLYRPRDVQMSYTRQQLINVAIPY